MAGDFYSYEVVVSPCATHGEVLFDVLDRIEAYLEAREDVRDGSDRAQLPNEAMSLRTELIYARVAYARASLSSETQETECDLPACGNVSPTCRPECEKQWQSASHPLVDGDLATQRDISDRAPVEWCKAGEFGCDCGRSEYKPCPLPHPRSAPSAIEEPVELVADPEREGMEGMTGILVRAKDSQGRWGSRDIAELTRTSLHGWLRSRGGKNLWAENCVIAMLGHDQLREGD